MKRTVLLFFIVLACNSLFSQPIEMFQQFNGRYNYTAFGNTLNEFENNEPNANCTFLLQSSANFNLPPTQTLVAALLYWSGVGSGDFDVSLNGENISAERTFLHDFSGLDYFAAYTDVTSLVMSAGNGSYTLSDLDLSSIQSNYCGTDYAGWAVIAIYEDPTLPLNQIGLFDGLESVSALNPSLSILLENIEVVNTANAKIGFLAWEGDSSVAVNETLRINGNTLSNPPLNPADNVFNGTNSFTSSTELYNMDLDFYTIDSYIDIGDIDMNIEVTSNQDMVLLNNIITVINSELPDATIHIDTVLADCENNDIEINYTAYNVNSTDLLPANTPISFYANGVFIGLGDTTQNLGIGENEVGSSSFSLPSGLPSPFVLTAVVDRDATGNGIRRETNESNNDFQVEVVFDAAPAISPIDDYVVLDPNNDGFEEFDLTSKSDEILNGQTGITLSFYEVLLDAQASVNAIANPTSYINIVNPQTIYVRLDDQVIDCSSVTSFIIFADANLGINQNVFVDFKITPNPASSTIEIVSSLVSSESVIKIFDLNGREVLFDKSEFQNEMITLTVENLPAGLYFVRVTSEGNSITKKLIKK